MIFPRGADPPANDPRATTLTGRSSTSSFLRLILAAGAGGRSARGGASGRKGPQEEGRGGTGEGGQNGNAWGSLHGVTETGRDMTARERTTVE